MSQRKKHGYLYFTPKCQTGSSAAKVSEYILSAHACSKTEGQKNEFNYFDWILELERTLIDSYWVSKQPQSLLRCSVLLTWRGFAHWNWPDRRVFPDTWRISSQLYSDTILSQTVPLFSFYSQSDRLLYERARRAFANQLNEHRSSPLSLPKPNWKHPNLSDEGVIQIKFSTNKFQWYSLYCRWREFIFLHFLFIYLFGQRNTSYAISENGSRPTEGAMLNDCVLIKFRIGVSLAIVALKIACFLVKKLINLRAPCVI